MCGETQNHCPPPNHPHRDSYTPGMRVMVLQQPQETVKAKFFFMALFTSRRQAQTQPKSSSCCAPQHQGGLYFGEWRGHWVLLDQDRNKQVIRSYIFFCLRFKEHHPQCLSMVLNPKMLFLPREHMVRFLAFTMTGEEKAAYTRRRLTILEAGKHAKDGMQSL